MNRKSDISTKVLAKIYAVALLNDFSEVMKKPQNMIRTTKMKIKIFLLNTLRRYKK
jgi:hypothetical protein